MIVPSRHRAQHGQQGRPQDPQKAHGLPPKAQQPARRRRQAYIVAEDASWHACGTKPQSPQSMGCVLEPLRAARWSSSISRWASNGGGNSPDANCRRRVAKRGLASQVRAPSSLLAILTPWNETETMMHRRPGEAKIAAGGRRSRSELYHRACRASGADRHHGGAQRAAQNAAWERAQSKCVSFFSTMAEAALALSSAPPHAHPKLYAHSMHSPNGAARYRAQMMLSPVCVCVCCNSREISLRMCGLLVGESARHAHHVRGDRDILKRRLRRRRRGQKHCSQALTVAAAVSVLPSRRSGRDDPVATEEESVDVPGLLRRLHGECVKPRMPTSPTLASITSSRLCLCVCLYVPVCAARSRLWAPLVDASSFGYPARNDPLRRSGGRRF